MCLTAKNFGLHDEKSTSPTRRETALIKKTGWGTTGRETDGQNYGQEGRDDSVLYEKGSPKIKA